MGATLTREREGEGGFLNRWSRRKRTSGEETVQAEQELPEVIPEPTNAPDDDAITPEELAALPTPEEITEGTDIKPFLRPGVPPALKNAALRRIWMLTPAIRDHRDLAVDYAWDWNTPGGVPGSSGEVGAKAVTDLIERLGKGRQSGDEGDKPLEVSADSQGNHVNARDAEQVTDKAPAPEPHAERKASVREVGEARHDSGPRHGGARPI